MARTAKQGREREKPTELICALSWAQVCMQSVNQSLLLEISISSRRLKLNIHPAFHENEQGRNNSEHSNVQMGAVGSLLEGARAELKNSLLCLSWNVELLEHDVPSTFLEQLQEFLPWDNTRGKEKENGAKKLPASSVFCFRVSLRFAFYILFYSYLRVQILHTHLSCCYGWFIAKVKCLLWDLNKWRIYWWMIPFMGLSEACLYVQL